MRSPRPLDAASADRLAGRVTLPPALPVLLAVLLLAAGCSEPAQECGPGTREVDGSCVPVCGDGTEADAETGECLPVCELGTHRDEETGACMPDHARCISGEVWDAEAAECVDVQTFCAEGTIWVASEGRCVDELELRTPDQVEGDGDNDYDGTSSTCEDLLLPEIGETRTFAGRIDEPEVDHDAVSPDDDCWSFRVEEPTLLRIRIDGLGGASAAFVLKSYDRSRFVERVGLGTTGSTAFRDVFIAEPGLYTLVVTDALNLARGGPWHGGGDFGYFAEVQVLPLPEAQEMVLEDGMASARGSWPVDPPAEGTGIQLFKVTVPDESLFFIELRTPHFEAIPAVMTTSPVGNVRYARWDSFPQPVGFGEGGEVLIAVDVERFASSNEVPYTLAIEQEELTILENDSGSFSLHQPSWSQGGRVHEEIFGLRVEKDEVIALDITSSTGRTCFWVWNENFDLLAGDRGCMVYNDRIFEEEIRFEVRQSGLHLIFVHDWDRAATWEGNLISIPAHSYEISMEARRYPRHRLDPLDEPSAVAASVTELDWESYFGLSPNEGDIFRFLIEPEGDFDPFFMSYRLGPVTSSMPSHWYPSNHREFACRSTRGWEELFGISDRLGRAGSFTLHAERYSPPVMGPLEDSGVLELTHELEEGRSRHLYQVEAETGGWLDLEVRPPLKADLAIVALDDALRQVASLRIDEEGFGGTERFAHGVPRGTVFLELVSADGSPVPSEVVVDMDVGFTPFTPEQEPNDQHTEAQQIELPGAASAVRNRDGDLDWYTFTLEADSTVDVITGPLGWGFFGKADLALFRAGTVLAEARGADFPDRHAKLMGQSLDAGTYHVLVFGSGKKDNTYFVEISHADQ